MSRVPGSIGADAEQRGVSPAIVRRERARAQIEPGTLRQIHFLSRVLGISPSTVAAQLGITEATVAQSFAVDPPAPMPSMADVKAKPSASITVPSVVSCPMDSVRLS
jgi:hypothetical protein